MLDRSQVHAIQDRPDEAGEFSATTAMLTSGKYVIEVPELFWQAILVCGGICDTGRRLCAAASV